MRKMWILALVLFGLAGSARADLDSKQLAERVNRYMDERAFAVLYLDLSKLDPALVGKGLRSLTGLDADGVAQPVQFLTKFRETALKHEVEHMVVLFSLADIPNQPPVVLFPSTPAAHFKAFTQAILDMKLFPGAGFTYRDEVLALGTKPVIDRLRKLKPTPVPELQAALRAGEGAPIRGALVATDAQRRIFEEVTPNLPKELGGESTKVISRGLKWASLRVSLQPELEVSTRFETADAPSAKSIATITKKVLDKLIDLFAIDADSAVKAKWKNSLEPNITKNSVTMAAKQAMLVSLVKVVFADDVGAKARTSVMNDLKQIGLAMHGYHDAQASFPARASFDKKGKALLSWRVHLLPYLEQAELYKQFKLDEPWDSEHNKKLIAKMPPLFAPKNKKLAAAGKTTLVVPVGKNTLFPPDRAVKIQAVRDGTSNTILVVDVNDESAVIWTKPDDWKLDEKKPMNGLVGHYPKGFLALFADGSVRFISKEVKAKDLVNAFLRNDGNVIELP